MEFKSQASIPVVLYISHGEKGIEIKGHEAPVCVDFNQWIDKNFPGNLKRILDNYEENKSVNGPKLQEIINTQVEMDNKN